MKTPSLLALPRRLVKFVGRRFRYGLHILIIQLPFLHAIKNTRNTAQPRQLSTWFFQKVLRYNAGAYWPVHRNSIINLPENIVVGVDSSPGVNAGCYIQAMGRIEIGDCCYFGPNIGIMAGSHNPLNLDDYVHGEVLIGSYCWVGMGAIILPNVRLGDFTIVGAGSIVTKSFPNGRCVIAGNPARLIRELNPDDTPRVSQKSEYVGYIHQRKFAEYRRQFLSV